MPLRGAQLAEAALTALFGSTHLTADSLGLVGTKAEAIFKNFALESKRIADFKFDIRWKSRVINVPKAIKHFQDLWSDIQIFIHTRGDLFKQPFTDFKAAVDAIGTIPREPGESRLTQGFEEVAAFIQALDKLITDVQTVLDRIAEFQDLFDKILADVEKLDGAFLPQNSQRNKTTLTYFKRSS